MKVNLHGQIVLLAGATGGIGASIVRYLSEAGATIAIQYHRHKEKAEELQESAGNDSQVFQANLDDLTQTEHLFQEVITAYGRVDTLINSAGIYLPFRLDKGTGNGWRTGRGQSAKIACFLFSGMRKPLHDASTSIDHTTCTADWDLSRELAQQSDIPVILAGGLSPENVFEALERKLREREAALPANCASPRQSMAIEALEKEIALLPAFF